MKSTRFSFFSVMGPVLILWAQLPSVPAPFSDVCSTFPKDSDRCGDPKPRFFYNSTSKACEPFTYRGCSWFRNRFYTIEECQRHCGGTEKPGSCLPSPRNITLECLASCLHDGNCPGDQKCCSYGCALRCSEPVKDICKLPPDYGPCHGKFRSWYYDERDQNCKRFIYSGCLGNENKFKKRRDCLARCKPAGSS
ncbi:fused toxin protein-like [Podarcis raffonei]|uniref:fused toxin protein-like n=1 Tax=Podarcis raffonei TaxID=65483 RepID=UPI002329608A|nr:fused toxin protein-like [Podarcis raffonei]